MRLAVDEALDPRWNRAHPFRQDDDDLEWQYRTFNEYRRLGGCEDQGRRPDSITVGEIDAPLTLAEMSGGLWTEHRVTDPLAYTESRWAANVIVTETRDEEIAALYDDPQRDDRECCRKRIEENRKRIELQKVVDREAEQREIEEHVKKIQERRRGKLWSSGWTL